MPLIDTTEKIGVIIASRLPLSVMFLCCIVLKVLYMHSVPPISAMQRNRRDTVSVFEHFVCLFIIWYVLGYFQFQREDFMKHLLMLSVWDLVSA